jgi:hypothetical protein
VAVMRWLSRRGLPALAVLLAGTLASEAAHGVSFQAGSGVGTAVRGAVRSGAPSRTAANLQAPAAEQTHPLVTPSRGRRSTAFTLIFTLREEPGHHGVLAVDYRVSAQAPPNSRARCHPASVPDVVAGHTGTAVRVALSRPPRGWCAGTYAVTVFLQRGPYCPKPPLPGAAPNPCPEFASQDLDTGSAHFRVQNN